MSRLIEKRVSEVSEPDLLRLFEELEIAIGLSPDRNQWIFHYLHQFLYPLGGSEKRRPINKNEINPVGILSRKLREFEGTPIFQVCEEIAQINGQTTELWETSSLYVVLNKCLPDFKKLKKPPKSDPWGSFRRHFGN